MKIIIQKIPNLLIVLIVVVLTNCSTMYQEMQCEPYENYCDYIVIMNEFEMTILDYNHTWVGCGNRAYASNCIGVTDNHDTIRVLSLCNQDSTFKVGQKVMVTPREKPRFSVSFEVYCIENSSMFIPELHKKVRKTIYGKMKKI